MSRWTVRAQYVTGDGTTADWSHRFRRRPSTQLFPDGRGLIRDKRGSMWHLSGVDLIERRRHRTGLPWLLAAGLLVVGWRLLVRAAERFDEEDR